MKVLKDNKVLLLFFFITFNCNYLFSQSPCSPDTNYTQYGIYPDSITGLPLAPSGTPYTTIINIKVQSDTTAPIIGLVYVDSVEIVSVSGLSSIPSQSFSYQCDMSSCTWSGGANGCILFSGNPVIADSGSYPLIVTVRAYLRPANTSYSAFYQDVANDDYDIVIQPPVGIQHLNDIKFSVAQNIPNPFTENTEIFYAAASAGKIEFSVYNMLGIKVFNKFSDAQKGTNTIMFNSKNMSSGIYFYNISNQTKTTTVTKRMVIENK